MVVTSVGACVRPMYSYSDERVVMTNTCNDPWIGIRTRRVTMVIYLHSRSPYSLTGGVGVDRGRTWKTPGSLVG